MKVLIADDHQIVRAGFRLLVETWRDDVELFEAEDMPSLQQQVEKIIPDLVLMDYRMPGGDPFEIINSLKQILPEGRLVIFTGVQSTMVIKQLLAVGVNGILMKDSAGEELLTTLDAVLAGHLVVSSSARKLLEQTSPDLTRREFEVMGLAASGLSSADIAKKLGLSSKTIDKHRENLMRKLEVKNVVELVNFVHEHELK